MEKEYNCEYDLPRICNDTCRSWKECHKYWEEQEQIEKDHCNDKALELMGHTEEEMFGKK